MFVDVDECADAHDCTGLCNNIEGSYYCSCEAGYTIASDGRTCIPVCGGNITADSGSLASPGWPDPYPSLNYTCEWNIETGNNTIIDCSFVEPFGIGGNSLCRRDYVQITCTDTYEDPCSGLSSLGKFCSQQAPGTLTVASSEAAVTFQASSFHSGQNVGFNITFTSIERGKCTDFFPRLFWCILYCLYAF